MRIQPANQKEMPLLLRLIFRRQRRIYGKELIAARVWARVPALFLAFARCFTRFSRRKTPLDPVLRARVSIRVSQINECSFCIDLNSYLLLKKGNRTNFTEADKVALDYAEAICAGPVSDELFERVRGQFTEPEIVELTALIALQLASSRFNVALEVPSQDLCAVSTSG